MHTGILALMVYSCISTVLLIGIYQFGLFDRKWLSKYFSSHLVVVLKFAISCVIVVPCLYLGLLSVGVGPGQNVGQIGDFIGGILNPLLSFMALIAVLVSIRTQENAQEKQEKILGQQLFEASLFNLMAMLRSRRSEFRKFKVDGVERTACQIMSTQYKSKRQEIDAKGLAENEAHEEGMEFLKKSSNIQDIQILREQFRLIIDFIEDSSLSFEQKTKYYRIAYGDFTQSETTCMANSFFMFNGLREVLQRHNLARTLDERLLSVKMRGFYSDNVYSK